MNDAMMEIPKYTCHKQVRALKIKTIKAVDSDNNGLMSFIDERFADIYVDGDYMDKHDPQDGGYYVVYKDGYKSFSPAKAFEEGYTKD